ncbi:MAG: transposase [Candidatus Rokubacteria bacterium]|nr:transposase [Candidatus Rokubacteria bacterium]
MQRHLPNLLSYLRHHLTNAGLEGINAVVQWVKKTARGFRNAEHFETAVYFFHCGAWTSTRTKPGRARKIGLRKVKNLSIIFPRRIYAVIKCGAWSWLPGGRGQAPVAWSTLVDGTLPDISGHS